jgi:hypothetical protein
MRKRRLMMRQRGLVMRKRRLMRQRRPQGRWRLLQLLLKQRWRQRRRGQRLQWWWLRWLLQSQQRRRVRSSSRTANEEVRERKDRDPKCLLWRQKSGRGDESGEAVGAREVKCNTRQVKSKQPSAGCLTATS